MRFNVKLLASSVLVLALAGEASEARTGQYTLVVEPMDKDGKVLSHHKFKCARGDECLNKISLLIDDKPFEASVAMYFFDDQHLRVVVLDRERWADPPGPFGKSITTRLFENDAEWVVDLKKSESGYECALPEPSRSAPMAKIQEWISSCRFETKTELKAKIRFRIET